MVTRSEKRRTIMQDLLICIGLPILQMCVRECTLAVHLSTGCLQGCDPEYVVSTNRYNIFEDFGPYHATALMPPSFFLFNAWPVAIGTVSLFYCGECPGLPSAFGVPCLIGHTVTTICIFYKRHRQFMEILSSNPGLSRSRYFRLMAIAAVEICGTIPLGTFFIVYNARNGVAPWISWADTHSNYSQVDQVAAFIWKNDPGTAIGFEVFRWSTVYCAFVFFALFGFADEARQHYRRVYTTLASRIGYSTFTLQKSSHACVLVYPLCSVRPGSSGLHLAVHRQSLT
jgi:pheromone a factor receptor